MRYIVAVMLLVMVAACDNGPKPGTETTFSGATMGTTFNVKVIDLPNELPAEKLQAQLSTILKDVNDKMSLWVKDSELVRFNQSKSTDWINVSPDLFHVTDAAHKISQLSNGIFDVTIEPLIKLWGFSTRSPTKKTPSDQEIRTALASIGHDKIAFQAAPPALRKSHPDVTINLSAIAKGFGIDQLADYLESQGIENYMVEIGGDLRVKGTNVRREPWKIAIEKPDVTSRSVHRIVAINGAGMATSGDYRNFFERDGKRYTHIIDPRTGRPVAHRLASVSVLSKSAMQADGLATALLALGEVEGPALAEQHGIAAFFLIRDGEGFVEKRSSHFETYENKVQ
ncbi:Thiamine biosynthesis lipoprotein ApbE [Candidatus Terasakiella magnetica]|uniref:FAD:protein FMN transferase n=1 Tax=Candidatus Terasakiella magnetica TaxID=1867952 RepID=A0A1C3RJM9_9PROT|nr:FAD:protein FMN transferase [Candidatus Terasakiella magnetica]SCA57482.1 Thiamine biosynthesis lipoprotein ApbE [Candidatus Terasakiella magnetica]